MAYQYYIFSESSINKKLITANISKNLFYLIALKIMIFSLSLFILFLISLRILYICLRIDEPQRTNGHKYV